MSLVTISTSLYASQTLLLEQSASQPTTVGLSFENGVVISDLGATDWLTIASLVNLSSAIGSESGDAVVSIDAHGILTLHSNWYTSVTITAALLCDISASVRYGQLEVTPNVHPASGDLDLGYETGFQFQQADSMLPVPARIRTPDGHRLINFQVVATFDTDFLSSSTDTNQGGGSRVE